MRVIAAGGLEAQHVEARRVIIAGGLEAKCGNNIKNKAISEKIKIYIIII